MQSKARFFQKFMIPILSVGWIFTLSSQPAEAKPETKVWTTTQDFAGTSGHKNTTWTDVPNQVQIIKNPPKSKQTPFLYVPNNNPGNVVQIDTKTGKINWTFNLDTISNLTGVRKGRTSPSRTTVDANGDVWVGLRGVSKGDSNAVVHLSKQGKLLRVVKTGSLPRAISVDLKGNVWVGNWVDNTVVKLDGKTGKKLLTVRNIACPYGAVADINNKIWVVNNCKWDTSNTLTKLDQNGKVLGRYAAPGGYGIATDLNGQVWVANWPGGCLHRFNNSGKNLGCIRLSAHPRGVAIDGDGNVWVPCSHSGNRKETSMVLKLSSSGQIVGRYTNVGRHSIGAAVDADGFIWVISYRQNQAVKINAKTGQTVGRYYSGGTGPYTYSDMTGFAFQSLANPAQGYWRAQHSTKCIAKWKSISWNGQKPAGTSITVRARTAASKAALATAKWSAPLTKGAKPAVPDAPWIEVEVSLTTQDSQITPYVADVTIVSEPAGTEICNGRDDDCDGKVDNIPGTDKPITKPCKTACGTGIRPCQVGDWSICSAPYPTPEVCDGKDNDCDGKTDEAATCDGNSVCGQGACMKPCVQECSPGYICKAVNGKKLCVGTKSCAQIEAQCKQQGKVCRNGNCVDPCFGIKCPDKYICEKGLCVQNDCYSASKACPKGQICQQGKCVIHPCANVQCAADQACKNGACIASCAGVQCPNKQSCREGKCQADPCAGVQCQGSQVCVHGQCTNDPCSSVSCRPSQSCIRGQCVDDPCRGVRCPVGQVCRPPSGDCFGSNQPTKPDPIEFGAAPEGGTIPGNEVGPTPNTKDASDETPEGGPSTRRPSACLCSGNPLEDGAGMVLFVLMILGSLIVMRRPHQKSSK